MHRSPIKDGTLTEAVVQAIQAVHKGIANAGQQQLALYWIMGRAALMEDLAFQPGEDGRRDTDFALGRQYVGHLIRQLLLPATLVTARKYDLDRRRQSKTEAPSDDPARPPA